MDDDDENENEVVVDGYEEYDPPLPPSYKFDKFDPDNDNDAARILREVLGDPPPDVVYRRWERMPPPSGNGENGENGKYGRGRRYGVVTIRGRKRVMSPQNRMGEEGGSFPRGGVS